MESFKRKALQWASSFSTLCLLDSHGFEDPYSRFQWTLCAGEQQRFHPGEGTSAFPGIQQFIDRFPDAFIPGFLSYDLKNEAEALESSLPDHTGFDTAFFFLPRYTLQAINGVVHISGKQAAEVLQQILEQPQDEDIFQFEGRIRPRISRQGYREAFDAVSRHIQRGDIYEMNLCQEFYAAQCNLNPVAAYMQLSQLSPTPFSGFLCYDRKYIISASPERFLQKTGSRLISQPIKGTARRYADPGQDARSRQRLRDSEKERSENVMIVDLVRHDLTRSARPASVQVPGFLEIQSFRQVHQMVSTVSAEARRDLSSTEIIRNTFPPGSMTGAPKKRAMEIIEACEFSRRGVYSGCMGYFKGADFDFNVIIRSLLFNAQSGYLSFHVGGAITAASLEASEYEECLLKASAIQSLLGSNLE